MAGGVTRLCSGYPGAPEILPSHHLIEQSPGYGHPYLPSDHTDIELDHFLWTGDIASEEVGPDQEEEAGFSVSEKIYPGQPAVVPSSVLVTREGTVFTSTIRPTPVFVPFGSSTSVGQHEGEGSGSFSPLYPTYDPPASHSQPQPYYESERTNGVAGGVQYTNGYYDMPEPEFLIRTVIRNDTDLLRRSVDLQAFKVDMEARLTRTYRQAYDHLEVSVSRRKRTVGWLRGLFVPQQYSRSDGSVQVSRMTIKVPSFMGMGG